MGNRDGQEDPHDLLTPALREPVRQLQKELSRLKEPSGEARGTDVIVARLLDAVRQLGEAIEPLIRSGAEVREPLARPVLAFRRDSFEQASGEPRMRGPRVLVVEPEPSVSEYIENHLDRAGFDVLSIPRVDEALEAARVSQPDVVTIDQLVLRYGGVNPIVRFKTEPALARIPIVLVRSPELEEPPHPFGIAAMVTKPIEPEDLVRALRQVTDDTVGAAAPEGPEAPEEQVETEIPGPRVVRG